MSRSASEKLLEVKQHPNADRLTIPVVGYGDGRSIEVVTGAPNIRPGMHGDKVVLALSGARLIDGHATRGNGSRSSPLSYAACAPKAWSAPSWN